jgi:V8-like Glu-specific endopeptidase
MWKKIGVTLFAVSAASACGIEQEMIEEDTVASTTQAVVSPQHAGKGAWTDLGPITVRPAGTPANLALAKVKAQTTGDGADGRRDTFIVDDLSAKRRYRVRYDWSAVLTPEQMTGPREDRSPDLVDPRAEQIEAGVANRLTNGWSNGIDSRTRRDLAAFSSTFDPYESFAFVGTGCSGTMIRQTANGTFAMTAAHCMYDNAGNPIFTTVQPRRDGGTLPYGTWNVISIHRYDYWVNNACYVGSSQTDDCRRYDIVLLELSPQAGATYPGGMTYGSYSQSTIDSHTKYHRGYPGCGAVDSPTGCVSQTLYGDNSHLVDNFRRSDRLFDHSSDTSGGHSGGPMYFYDGDPKFYGVHSGSYCSGAACNSLYTSISVRISTDWFDYVYDQLHN